MRTLNQYINEWKYNDGNNVYDPHKIVYRDLEAWSNMLLKKYKIHCSDFDFGIVDIYPDNAETHDDQKYPHIPITVDSKWWHGCSGWKNFSISDESNFEELTKEDFMTEFDKYLNLTKEDFYQYFKNEQ